MMLKSTAGNGAEMRQLKMFVVVVNGRSVERMSEPNGTRGCGCLHI